MFFSPEDHSQSDLLYFMHSGYVNDMIMNSNTLLIFIYIWESTGTHIYSQLIM